MADKETLRLYFMKGRKVIRNSILPIYASARDRTKSKKSYRTLSLFPTAEALLKRVIEEKKNNKKYYGSTYYDSEYVFTWEDGHLRHPLQKSE